MDPRFQEWPPYCHNMLHMAVLTPVLENLKLERKYKYSR